MGNLKISTTLLACIGLRNNFEMYFLKGLHSYTVNLFVAAEFYLDECEKDYLVKILKKLNNAIINQKNTKVTISLTQGQAEILQKFILKNGFLATNKTINKADIFTPFE